MKGCAVVKKKSSCQCRICRRCGFDPWVGNISWKKKWQPIPYSYLENSMDRVHRVAKTWMWLSNWAGEGNGTPLQYSCLENPVDRGAWWAAVHGVAQSRTWLKQLSMHACMHEWLSKHIMKVLSVWGNKNIHKIWVIISLYVVMCEEDSLRDKFMFKVKNVEGKNDSVSDVLYFSLLFF